MTNQTNYNHLHRLKERIRADFLDGELTVGDIRDAIALLPDDVKVIFGPTSIDPEPPVFRCFDLRDEKLLQLRFDRFV